MTNGEATKNAEKFWVLKRMIHGYQRFSSKWIYAGSPIFFLNFWTVDFCGVIYL